MRSLISDLGKACNTRAHMTGLLRTKQGKFQLNDCLYQNEWYVVVPHSLTHSLTHPLTHSLTHSFTHSLTHQLKLLTII